MSSDSLVDKAVNAIIRPPRRHYNVEQLPLIVEASNKKIFVRHPLNFSNSRDQKIVGSIYVNEGQDIMNGGPCIIYMHGNSSSQLEGQFLVPNLCPHGVAVYCFDFAGCGESDGDFISLGYYETQDIEYLMDFLNSTFNLGPFALWGRSMGAATSVLARHPLLRSIIVDSTFTSIKEVCGAIAKSQRLPSVVVPAVVWFLKRTVSGRAGFDIEQVSPLLKAAEDGAVPCIIGHATDDDLIPVDQGRRVYSAYKNKEKEFVHLYGGHNGRRNDDWIKKCCQFVLKNFELPFENFEPQQFSGFSSQEDNKHFSSFDEMIGKKKYGNGEKANCILFWC